MVSSKLSSIKSSLQVAKYGATYKSRISLFCIKILNHVGHHRVYLRNVIKNIIILLNKTDEYIYLVLKLNSRIVKVKLRLEDYSDYQSLGECLGNMYEIEDKSIKYFIDGGANIGFFSLKMLCFKNIQEGVLIEANPLNVELLKFNFSSINHYSMLPVALTNRDGNIVFELATSNTGHVSGSIGHPTSNSTVVVASKRIINVIPKHWDLNQMLLKLDIEGAEYEVLDDLLNNNLFPKVILAEIHDYLRAGGKELVQRLTNAGYRVNISGSGQSGNVCRQISAYYQN